MKRSRVLYALTAAATGAALVVGPAQAHPREPEPVTSELVTPLQMAVGRGGIYVAEAFAGMVTKVRWDGSRRNLVTETEPGTGIGGVAVRRYELAYTTNNDEGEGSAYLKLRKPSGKTRVVADLQAFEEKRNPDSRNTYGFLDLTPECAAQVPPEIGGEPYNGIVDTNPYALANGPRGGWYVADAGANAILHVSRSGKVHTVAVLKPQKVMVTTEQAVGLGLPECVGGATYAFEPVPTDVEVSRSGHLFVSLLPGGPEDPSLGARGAVVKVNPWKGWSWTVADGFFAATNLALGPKGRIYVAELFGGQVSMVRHGEPKPLVQLSMPAAVEYHRGSLLVSTDALSEAPPFGSIVRIKLW